MSDKTVGRDGEKDKCPSCGKVVKFDIVESTAMGSGGGREYTRGVARCTTQGCPNKGSIVRPV
jgi:hypothetical protein